MGMGAIRELADRLAARLAEQPDEDAFQQASRLAHLLDELDLEAEDGPPVGPGFVCLPIEAHDRLREAEARAERLREELAAKERHAEAVTQEWQRIVDGWRQKYERLQAEPAERAESVWGPLRPVIASDPLAREQLADLRGEWGGLKGLIDAEVDQRRRFTDTFTSRLGEQVQELRRLQGLIEEVCKQHRGMNARLDHASQAVEEQGRVIAGLDERIETLEAELGKRIDAIEAELDGLHGPAEGDAPRQDRLRDLESRVAALEGERIEAHEGEHEGRIKALEDALDVLPDLDALKAQVRRLLVGVAGLEDAGRGIRGEVKCLQVGLANLVGRLDERPDRIEALKARVNRLEVREPPRPIEADGATLASSPA